MAEEKESDFAERKLESSWMPSIWVFFGEDEQPLIERAVRH
jgi:hypothetical protein